jgi:hypothetical protein
MLGVMQSIHRKDRYVAHYNLNLKSVLKGHYRIIMKGLAPS